MARQQVEDSPRGAAVRFLRARAGGSKGALGDGARCQGLVARDPPLASSSVMDVVKDRKRKQDVAVQEASHSSSVADRTISVVTRRPSRTRGGPVEASWVTCSPSISVPSALRSG